jgi:hypothetical protein
MNQLLRARIGRVVCAGLTGFALLFGSGCASVQVSLFPAVLTVRHKPFLLAQSGQAYGWGVLSHPRIIQLDSNTLIVRFYVGGDNAGQDDPAGRQLTGVSPAVSRDGGKTWVFGESNLDARVAAATGYWGCDMKTPDGLVVCGQNGLNCLRLRGEEVLDGPWKYELQPYSSNVYFGPYERGVWTTNGELLAVGMGSYLPTWGGKTLWRTALLKSRDGAKSWTVESIVSDADHTPWGREWWFGFEGPNEPALAVHGGELVSVARVGIKISNQWETPRSAVRMIQSRSRDGGKTWKHKQLSIEGASPRLLPMSNGLLAMAFGRPGNNVAFTSTGGKAWGNEVVLSAADSRTSGYCDIAEVAPGRLFAVFDAYNTDLDGLWLWEPTEVNGVFAAYISVYRLNPFARGGP